MDWLNGKYQNALPTANSILVVKIDILVAEKQITIPSWHIR
jgi:hypothetical protein